MRKRKRNEIQELREDLMQIISEWKNEQDQRISAILSTVTDIKDQNSDIRSSIDFMSKNYDDLLIKIEKLETERANSQRCLKILENKIEQIERGQNCSRIELRGVPRKDAETKKDLFVCVQNMAKSLNIAVEPNDIRDVYRINTKSEKSKPIVVDFNRVMLKEDILKSLKSYNRENKDKFNTLQLQIHGPAAPVYISECLTPQSRKLFASARVFARENSYRYCWTSFGRIYLRKSEGDKLIRVDTEQDLDNIK